MNALDILIIAIGGFCLVRGIFRGIVVKEITSIVGVILGYYGAYNYYYLLEKPLSQVIANKSYLYIISFFLIFTIVFLAIRFAGMAFKRLLKTEALSWVDHVVGGGFAFVKACLIVSVVLVALATFLPKNPPVIRNSVLARRMIIFSEIMVSVVPTKMEKKFRDNINALKLSWKKP
ncbi:MAG: CvpA family protein [Desulfobacterales bacterium]|nr:CvpA family protein [Desulfobacterales bacterium]